MTNGKSTTKTAVTTSTISAVTAIIVAIITALATYGAAIKKDVETGKMQVQQEATNGIQKINTESEKTIRELQVIKSGPPVGTVVASMYRLESSIDLLNMKTVIWVPADGRDVTGSRYNVEYRLGSTVPDLRGLFIRGLNSFEPGKDRLAEGGEAAIWSDPDGNGRKAGSTQPDALKDHTHNFLTRAGSGVASQSGNDNYPNVTNNTLQTQPGGGGKETRPRNAALYYYIKIN